MPQVDPALVHQAIRELPAKGRTVLVLRALEGYSHKEIAENLGISVSTSKTQYSRALTLLHGKLKEKRDVQMILKNTCRSKERRWMWNRPMMPIWEGIRNGLHQAEVRSEQKALVDSHPEHGCSSIILMSVGYMVFDLVGEAG